ncbi:MAG: phosphoribosylamine--glycine ligase [Candidatus Aenigmarchaeota archaeon]|nr:phosphoribosylamine--glycine ligase [Candidatus Aenigmarchaeota archaeon]
MMSERILIVGSGGREHAIGWKIKNDNPKNQLYFAPGNAGTLEVGEPVKVPHEPTDLAKYAADNDIDLTIIGPEDPLAKGVVDHFNEMDLAIYGPTRDAAMIETSKVWAKGFMERHGIPTAKGLGVFSDSSQKGIENALAELEKIRYSNPFTVIKADGLAAGKGVLLPATWEDVVDAVYDCMDAKKFGHAGETILVEERLFGDETSAFAITDGVHYRLFDSSEDYKRVGEGDTGLNTGGMGCFSPSLVVTDDVRARMEREIIAPMIKGMAAEGRLYRGTVYLGAMITDKGPHALEFNARLGDPETEVLLPRMKSRLLPYLQASAVGGMAHLPEFEWGNGYCAYIVLRSGWYPGEKPKGYQVPISGLDAVARMKDVQVFHAGTKYENGMVLGTGGRVLGVAGLGDSPYEAIGLAVEAAERIMFEGRQFRKDIGHRSLKTLGL